MAFYRELRYRAPSWDAHVTAWHRADDLPAVVRRSGLVDADKVGLQLA